MSRTPLPLEIQAAIDANVTGDAMRGFVLVISTVVESLLNPAFLPSPGYCVVAALCEDLTQWVVVAGPMSPYAHVRPPIDGGGVSICTVDLRNVRADTQCAEGIPPDVWRRVQEAARRYGVAHPPLATAPGLADMRPEGHA